LTVKLGVRLSSRRTVLGSHLFPACPAAGSPPSPGKGGTQWARWSRRGVDRVRPESGREEPVMARSVSAAVARR